MTALDVLFLAAGMVALVWPWLTIALAACRLRRALRPGSDLDLPPVRALFHELRPFYLPAVALFYASEAAEHGIDGWWWLRIGCGVLNWFLWKDGGGDDDRWKRRRRKAVEKVAQFGGRLTVVPASGGAS